MDADDTLCTRLRMPDQAGVRCLAGGERVRLEACARALGFAHVDADLRGCTDKPAFLARIATALRFPDWFGHNWDALADCLADLSWLPAPGYVVVLDGIGDFRRAAPDAFATALDILDEACRTHAAHGIPLWFFIAREATDRDGPPRP
jgi:RNAse (barnase) inhibitor barstar